MTDFPEIERFEEGPDGTFEVTFKQTPIQNPPVVPRPEVLPFWPEVLAAVMRRDRRARAFLSEARVVSADRREVVVALRWPGLVEFAAGRAEVLDAAVVEVLGEGWRMVPCLAEPAAGAAR